MALPLGKLVILAGAGLIGASTVYAKDSGITDWLSGATKILKHLKQDTGSGKKPQNDSLMAQVNSLRQELQLLASNRPVTIITSGGAGANKYYIIVVVGVIGYGYVWWKGWKLPDMMFATRRTLSDACNSVAQQLDTVYASLRTTRKELSADILNLDTKLTEIEEITDSTHGIVVELRTGSEKIGNEFKTFKQAVEMLESRVDSFAVEQNQSLSGIGKLLVVAHEAQTRSIEDNRQNSSSSQISFTPRRALPPPAVADGPSPSLAASDPSPEVLQTPRRIVSLPSTQQVRPCDLASDPSPEVLQPPRRVVSLPSTQQGSGSGVAGVTELTGQGIWNGISTPEVMNRGESSSSSSSAAAAPAVQRQPSFLARTLSSAAGTVLKRTGLKQ